MVEVMTWLVKMAVEGQACGTVNIVAMCVESEVGWWFRFAHILELRALEAVAKVDAVGALAG